MFSKRKGFTLVELLIVIIVIGILAGAMMLASGAMTDSARGSSIVSELRNGVAAGSAWYGDHAGTDNAVLDTSWVNEAIMEPYMLDHMNNSNKATEYLYAMGTFGTRTSIAMIGLDAGTVEVARKAVGQAQGSIYGATGGAALTDQTTETELYMRVE